MNQLIYMVIIFIMSFIMTFIYINLININKLLKLFLVLLFTFIFIFICYIYNYFIFNEYVILSILYGLYIANFVKMYVKKKKSSLHLK